MKRKWLVNVAVDGRDKGVWSHTSTQPWTAVQKVLQNLGTLENVVEVQVRVTPASLTKEKEQR